MYRLLGTVAVVSTLSYIVGYAAGKLNEKVKWDRACNRQMNEAVSVANSH